VEREKSVEAEKSYQKWLRVLPVLLLGKCFFCLLAKRASNILGQFLFLLFEFKNKTQMTKEEGNSNV
jgi:hypothetical protein